MTTKEQPRGMCVEGDGWRDRDGYMLGKRHGKMRRLHRVAYAAAHGIDIDSDEMPEVVMHACDNPSCVNADHLVGGTQAENVADMVAKRRHNRGDRMSATMKRRASRGDDHYSRKHPDLVRRGEGHHNAKIGEHEAREIRRLGASGRATHQEIADAFGLSRRHVGKIVNGEKWTHA